MWRVSIVPIVAAPPDADFVPDELFSQAIRYAEHAGVDVVNISSGITFTKKGYDVKCSVVIENSPLQRVLDQAFTLGVEESVDCYGELFDGDGEALYVFSGGNDGHDTTDADVFSVPSMAIEQVIERATVIVGGSESSTAAHPRSAYGGVTLFAPYGPWTSLGVDDTVWSDDGFGNQIVGTSQAAPVVAGAAALLVATVPGFRGRPGDLKEALIDSASATVDATCELSDIVDQPLLDANALLGESP